MKRYAIFLVLFAASLASASVKTDIDRQYKRWAKAAVANDVETILGIMAPDYTLKTYAGVVVDHQKYEASLRKRREAKQPTDAYRTEIYSLSVKGKIATVISDETSEKPTVDPLTNEKLNMMHIHRYLDTWVKLGKDWRLRSTVTQLESTKIVPFKKNPAAK